jgi:triacylglycerol lipase
MNRIRYLGVAVCALIGLKAQPVEAQPDPTEADVKISRNVVYGNEAEPAHRADVYQLKSVSPDVLNPGIILIHGGAWFAGDKTNDILHAKRLAKMGFVVMAINYRLVPKHPFPAQIDDCYLAQEWLNSHAKELAIDPDHIGVWGYSAGGHLAALLATNPKEGLPRIKAAVVGAAPCDLTLVPEDSKVLSSFLGGSRGKYPQRYRDASPVTHVSSDDPPVFLFHGSKDWLVPPVMSQAMRDVLEEKGVPFEYVVVDKKAHLMTFIDHEATEKSFLFLKTHLPTVVNPRTPK